MAEAAAAQHQLLLACTGLLLLLLVSSSSVATARSIIKTLPGFPGELPFYLETGYVGVGENESVQLFYYFVKSQRNPVLDPLVLWLTGGPGCSTLSAFFYESGPVSFNLTYNGGLPTLELKEYTWTETLNIIYLDAPVGTGFSYSTTQEGYTMDDYKSAAQIYEFLKKWLIQHPEFLKNNLYIGGDSYSGIPVPMIVQDIYYGVADSERGGSPRLNLNLQGYVLGNPVTDAYIDKNSRVPFAHRLTLISDRLYESAKANCNGDYVNANASSEQCESDVQEIEELLRDINIQQILDPDCTFSSPKPNEEKSNLQRSLAENPTDFLSQLGEETMYFCHDYMYILSETWANNRDVREALHVREGTKGYWKRCNISGLAYTEDVISSVAYHRNLSKTGLRALIYSGDHDMSVPHIGTQQWIDSLNLTLADTWRAWYTEGQVAGYTKRYTNDDFALTYATVKGAGHVAPEYKPQQCYAMLKRWFAYYQL
ncbi:Serine carboxypeptidase-like 18 [Vitis vinifera]|uniref:Serine carboxypeptidase-like 18 n=1 Tax=Vitis vinifera TaxID=29760 RepID=A0A438H884_VITVI|nr:Serine carboxypeptidase-like 18 [Vitis vinifera]